MPYPCGSLSLSGQAAYRGNGMGGVRTTHDGAWLAEYVSSPGRGLPAIVVSVHPEKPEGWIDAGAIAVEADGLAEVFQFENGPQSLAFADGLPPGREVYGNAVRAYSVSREWLEDMRRSPLHLAASRAGAERAAREVVEDVVRMAPAPRAVRMIAPPARRAATGTVAGFAAEGHRAIVAFGDGTQATIAQDSAVPGVRLDWVLAVGQAVAGTLDPVERTFDISGLRRRPRLGECYRPGRQVLALVVHVKPASAQLRLFPGSDWTVRLDDVTSNPRDTMDMLLSEGEVLVARYTHVQGAVKLSIIDVDEDEGVAPAPSLVEGGTPWLALDRDLGGTRRDRDQERVAARPGDVGASGGHDGSALRTALRALESARSEASALRAQLGAQPAERHSDAEAAGLRSELDRARRDLESREADLAQMTAKAEQLTEDLSHRKAEANRQRKAARARERQLKSQDARTQFAEPGQWLRHELYEAWVRVVPASEKGRWPLPGPESFEIGPRFADSLAHDRVTARLSKAFDICIRAIVGDAALTAALDVHALRTGSGAEDPQLSRPDGALAFRASVEKNTPAALRLHYWKRKDGRIELDSVHPHDGGL